MVILKKRTELIRWYYFVINNSLKVNEYGKHIINYYITIRAINQVLSN